MKTGLNKRKKISVVAVCVLKSSKIKYIFCTVLLRFKAQRDARINFMQTHSWSTIPAILRLYLF